MNTAHSDLAVAADTAADVKATPAPAALRASYDLCGRIARRSGTSYWAATCLLPAAKRRQVHALYAFFRLADDIVDYRPTAPASDTRAAALEAFAGRFFADLDRGASGHPVLAAVVDAVATLRLEREPFHRFFCSMRADLTVSSYDTFDELLAYVDGSAAAVGELMLPLLEPTTAGALGPARDLGIAFQLTNFWRDVAEDLDRGRVYIPSEDLRRFDATGALRRRRVDSAWRELLAFEIARTRRYYDSASQGIAMLPPASARCVAGAHRLYSGIWTGSRRPTTTCSPADCGCPAVKRR